MTYREAVANAGDAEQTTITEARVQGNIKSQYHPTSHTHASHKMTQHPPLSPFSNVSSAALVAASNTSSTPSPVSEEHSRYLRAPISRAA